MRVTGVILMGNENEKYFWVKSVHSRTTGTSVGNTRGQRAKLPLRNIVVPLISREGPKITP